MKRGNTVCLIILQAVLLTREKLEDNLVNNMETIDNDLGCGQSSTANKPALMFKIAAKSKKQSVTQANGKGKWRNIYNNYFYFERDRNLHAQHL